MAPAGGRRRPTAVHAHSEQGRGCDCRMGGRGRAGGTLCAAQRQSPCGGGWTPREARRGRRGAASSARCTHHLLVALGLLGELGHVDVVGAGHAAKATQARPHKRGRRDSAREGKQRTYFEETATRTADRARDISRTWRSTAAVKRIARVAQTTKSRARTGNGRAGARNATSRGRRGGGWSRTTRTG